MKTLMSLLFAVVLLTSCDETKKVIDTAGSVQLSGTYTVNTLGGKNVANANPTISFAALDKTIRGNTGCNTFFGDYTLDLYALSFSEIGSTEKACDQVIMDNENTFLQALRNTGSYALENNVLTLYSKTDRSQLLTATKNTGN